MLGLNLQETRFYRDAEQEGMERETKLLVLRQLNRKIGTLSEDLQSQVEQLSPSN